MLNSYFIRLKETLLYTMRMLMIIKMYLIHLYKQERIREEEIKQEKYPGRAFEYLMKLKTQYLNYISSNSTINFIN